MLNKIFELFPERIPPLFLIIGVLRKQIGVSAQFNFLIPSLWVAIIRGIVVRTIRALLELLNSHPGGIFISLNLFERGFRALHHFVLDQTGLGEITEVLKVVHSVGLLEVTKLIGVLVCGLGFAKEVLLVHVRIM